MELYESLATVTVGGKLTSLEDAAALVSAIDRSFLDTVPIVADTSRAVLDAMRAGKPLTLSVEDGSPVRLSEFEKAVRMLGLSSVTTQRVMGSSTVRSWSDIEFRTFTVHLDADGRKLADAGYVRDLAKVGPEFVLAYLAQVDGVDAKTQEPLVAEPSVMAELEESLDSEATIPAI